ncbi:glycosyl-phosphatidylinositol-anchored molecule-like protein [Talpa occidentalis]|uniref:glycosyl-phosphatidylinositol-anchored molecule-like protein n=1 Tax=Talpa occidentalis TaxID=50954 RepID=UPI00188F15B9|nr:glycosyl-phosphatidylinositol-anchored molecule-like protein [Talpa occidentalis]
MLLCALLLAVAWPPAEPGNASLQESGTKNLKCFSCSTLNDFNCPDVVECHSSSRLCLTVSIRLNSRQLMIYKDCGTNCTFLYPEQVPPEAPRKVKTTHFYHVRCCGDMRCNDGGPTNLERDIQTQQAMEEIEGAERVGGPRLLLSLASLLASRALT